MTSTLDLARRLAALVDAGVLRWRPRMWVLAGSSDPLHRRIVLAVEPSGSRVLLVEPDNFEAMPFWSNADTSFLRPDPEDPGLIDAVKEAWGIDGERFLSFSHTQGRHSWTSISDGRGDAWFYLQGKSSAERLVAALEGAPRSDGWILATTPRIAGRVGSAITILSTNKQAEPMPVVLLESTDYSLFVKDPNSGDTMSLRRREWYIRLGAPA